MRWRRFAGLLVVLLSAAALAGAFALPLIHASFNLVLPEWLPNVFDLHNKIRHWLIESGRLPIGDQYLWGIIVRLFQAQEYVIGALIFLFSLLFPIVKIALATTVIGFGHWMTAARRHRLVAFLESAGRWSMTDVFIVAMVIVFFKAEGFHYRFTPRPGIFCYAASALLSALALALAKTRAAAADPLLAPPAIEAADPAGAVPGDGDAVARR